ncbi:hypothetical protein AAZX31_13G069100 [Glycine max]|uniref:Uncharacterized protein n=2 Tax=Glycine subgen. Soja TaxID=1462606 RepID=K7LX17_SOYBN|nr:hypothetical protein JHK87_035606 [Glycine soja]KAG4969987.1 hypothetical protein JHK85_036408 [Glycine max]KAG4976342.1 hypothetical protein JHK86_035816 [Glycine max]KAG5112413.1 hypothetical protein JHK82_035682 [Glycine max]KAG5129690.1 hypothetical protein JHK84_036087 [Glycine max]
MRMSTKKSGVGMRIVDGKGVNDEEKIKPSRADERDDLAVVDLLRELKETCSNQEGSVFVIFFLRQAFSSAHVVQPP